MTIDVQAVERWMDGMGLTGGPLEIVRSISGGTQNVMVLLRRDDRDFVLRRGPRHLRPRSNDTLRREVRILEALRDTPVRCPRLIAACDDETILGGAIFYLMEPVSGFNATVELPAPFSGDAASRHAMGLSVVDALAELHAVDHVAVGLDDVGRPEGFLTRQVPRWIAELESYKELEGFDGSDLPYIAETAAWLEAHVPSNWTPGLAHGDFHLANVMFAFDRPELAAIVDWEMWTVGDPLLDLAWLLITWPAPDAPHKMGAIDEAGGLPTPDELLARYATRTNRDLSMIHWYKVLACFKLAIILEGTYARACAGKADKAMGDFMHASSITLLTTAHKLTHGEPECPLTH